MKFHKFIALTAFVFLTLTTHAAVTGWTNWRGPHQAGRSDATDLPQAIKLTGAGSNLLWTHDIAGRGHAVIADGRVYTWGSGANGLGHGDTTNQLVPRLVEAEALQTIAERLGEANVFAFGIGRSLSQCGEHCARYLQ